MSFLSQLEALENQVLRTKTLLDVGILNDFNTFIFIPDKFSHKDQAIIIINIIHNRESRVIYKANIENNQIH